MAIKIFIGTSPNGEDREIERIYEYSLRKNTKQDLEIEWMKLNQDKTHIWGGWNTKKWFTPFSGFRWAIPYCCNFQGRAIYTDVDMINFNDINELHSMDLKGKPFAARKGVRWGYEFCVMVIDCKIAQDYVWDIKKLKKDPSSHSFHRNKIAESSNLVEPIDPRWNCLDGESRHISDIYQLHFTNMSTQPWNPSWFLGNSEPHPRADIVNEYMNLKDECDKKGISLREHPKHKINFKIQL